jgi:hypothetical protein
MLRKANSRTLLRLASICGASLLALTLAHATGCDGEKPEDGAKAGDDAKDDAADQADGGQADAAEDPEEAAEAMDPRVGRAVDIADKIDAEPGKADEILDAAGLDRDGLSELFYEIAADPELSQAYEAARSA